MPFTGHTIKKFRRSTILPLNIEGLIASKMTVLQQLAEELEALVILLQKTHCASTERLVIINFELAGSPLSRKHGLSTFVYELLNWTLCNQFPQHRTLNQSSLTPDTKWLCMDIDGYKIINIYKSPRTRLQTSGLSVMLIPIFKLVISTHHTLSGDIITTQLTGIDWIHGQALTIKPFFIIRRTQPASFPAAGKLELTKVLLSAALALISPTSQTCSRKVSRVTTSTLVHHST